MIRSYRAALAFACIVGLASPARAQDLPDAPEASQEPLRLFLDCSGFFCDPDFFRTEIAFVSHVRNRQDADLHVLITPQPTGGGGVEYTLAFVGQRAHQDRPQTTLRYVAPPAASEDDRRRGLARLIKLGLVPFVSETPLASNLEVTFRPPEGGTPSTGAALHDPWNRWSFRTSLNGNFNGESRSSSRQMFGSISANRVTEDWKLQFSTNGNERRSEFEINDSTTVSSEQHGYGINALVVRSLGSHLSAGLTATGQTSTFLNQDLRIRVAPAVEYNLFPYAESTRRQLTLQYSVGANSFDYREETIFGRTSQSMLDHAALASLNFRQRWGNVRVAAEGGQYLDDLSRYRGELFSNFDLRLIKGLSLNMFSSVSYVRDQLYLPAGDATPEEVLLRLRQLETSYFFYTSFGFSYTFGSIYNNVVNPRFGAGQGGF